MKTLQKVRVKRVGEKSMGESLVKVRVKILYKVSIKKDGCKSIGENLVKSMGE